MHDEHRNRFCPLKNEMGTIENLLVDERTATSFRFHLVSLEVRLVFNNFDETLKGKSTDKNRFGGDFHRFTIAD